MNFPVDLFRLPEAKPLLMYRWTSVDLIQKTGPLEHDPGTDTWDLSLSKQKGSSGERLGADKKSAGICKYFCFSWIDFSNP
jgi:hypothetical protein